MCNYTKGFSVWSVLERVNKEVIELLAKGREAAPDRHRE